MIQNLIKITEKLVAKGFSNLSKPLVKNISELIVAFFFNLFDKLETGEGFVQLNLFEDGNVQRYSFRG